MGPIGLGFVLGAILECLEKSKTFHIALRVLIGMITIGWSILVVIVAIANIFRIKIFAVLFTVNGWHWNDTFLSIVCVALLISLFFLFEAVGKDCMPEVPDKSENNPGKVRVC